MVHSTTLPATAYVRRRVSSPIEGSAQVESISRSASPIWKNHLLADDFFAADKHPEIAFRRSPSRRGEGIEVEGELDDQGRHEPRRRQGHAERAGDQPRRHAVVALALETVIDRTQYGLNWNAELPSGGKALANDVKIVVEAELVKGEA